MENIEFEPSDGKNIHPSLDIQEGVAILGFRYRAKGNEEKEVFIVSAGGSINLATENPLIIADKTFWLDTRGHRKLARLEERWGAGNLKQYLEEHKNSTYKTVSGKTVFSELVDALKRYIELEKDADYDLLAAWILGTYFYPVFAAYPFLHLKAPKGSGKSQCLTLLSQLCFNATKARPSLAALGDTVDALRGTYLVDQADSLGRIGHEDLLDIFCDSYKRSGGKRRIVNMDKSRGRETLEFETYSPKAFASIKELPEDLRDRCCVIQLTRSTRNNFPDPDSPGIDWMMSRAKLYELLLAEHVLVDGEYLQRRIHYKTDTTIVGRRLELWLPLEVILRLFGPGDRIEDAKRRFFVHYGSAEYEPGELEMAVIESVRFELGANEEIWMYPKEIAEKIGADCFYEENASPKRRASAVGWAIKKFNLSSEKKRSKDGERHLFRKDRIEEVYASYFKTASDHTSPTPPETEAQNVDGSSVDAAVYESEGIHTHTPAIHTPEKDSICLAGIPVVQEMYENHAISTTALTILKD